MARLLRAAAVMPLLGALAMGAGKARAADPTLTLAIAEQPRLTVGDVAAIEATLRFVRGGEQPIMLTLSIEGEAVDVVRGRLLRDDATRGPEGELRFRIPLVTRRPGSAVLRLEVATYACDPGCRPVRALAAKMLQVSAFARN
jgi:hypothetical protein